MIPEMRRLADGGHFILQQDGATAHTAKDTVTYLQQEVPEFIEPQNWPPNSPDMNPVDYSIWENLSHKVYHKQKIRDVDHLKEVIVEQWGNITQREIDASIAQFRPRLQKVVEVRGKHIEQYV